DDLHLAPQRAQPPLALLRDVTAPEADRAFGIEQPQQRETQRRLARAALADDPQRRAGAHLERDAVDRLHIALDAAKDAAADRKPYLDVIALDQDRRRRIGRRHPALRLRRQSPPCIWMLRLCEHG